MLHSRSSSTWHFKSQTISHSSGQEAARPYRERPARFWLQPSALHLLSFFQNRGDISSPLWSPWHPPHCSEIIHLYSSTITFSVRRERREHSHLKLKSLARIFPPQVNPPVVPVVGLNFTSRMKWSMFVQALPHKGRFAGGDHVMGELRLWLWRQEKLLRMWG